MNNIMNIIQNITIFLYIALIVIIIIDIVLFILLKIKNKKQEKRHKEEVNKLEKTINELIEKDKEELEEIIKETEEKEDISSKQEVKEVVATGVLPYSRKMLLTNYEYKCYKLIKPIADKYNLHIMSKVRIIDFISVNRGMTQKECYSYIGKIKQNHVDFVFCNPNNLYPLACLELDDSTHKSIKAQEKDKFKNEVFKSADIKLYRINNLNVDLEKMIKEISELNNN